MISKLIINDVEMNIGVKFLEDIASSIPDTESNQVIFNELAKSKSASVRGYIAYKDKLSEETAKLLLTDKDSEVLSNLLRNDVVQSVATDEDIEHMINTLTEEYLVNLIGYLDDYRNIDLDLHLENLLSLNSPVINYAIADNRNMPNKILRKLSKNEDPDVSNTAKESLDY